MLLLSFLAQPRLRLDGGGSAAHIIQETSIQYSRTDLYNGLPHRLAERVDEILDSRLAVSSQRSISAALAQWDVVREEPE